MAVTTEDTAAVSCVAAIKKLFMVYDVKVNSLGEATTGERMNLLLQYYPGLI